MLKTLATECEALGVKVLVVVADAMDPSQLTAAADKAFAAFGKLSILVNSGMLSCLNSQCSRRGSLALTLRQLESFVSPTVHLKRLHALFRSISLP